MHYRCVFIMLKAYVLVELDWVEPMIFLLLHVIYSCIHTFNSLYFVIDLCWYFSVCLSLSLSLSMRLACSMAPKRKSTPSQNPFCSAAASSSPSVNSTPSHVQFCDEKARTDFSENFSRRDIHSECQVVLLNFSDTEVPTVIYKRG